MSRVYVYFRDINGIDEVSAGLSYPNDLFHSIISFTRAELS